jgi:hypothetical protein
MKLMNLYQIYTAFAAYITSSLCSHILEGANLFFKNVGILPFASALLTKTILVPMILLFSSLIGLIKLAEMIVRPTIIDSNLFYFT